MRCRKATTRIGPYIDGELTATEAREIRDHLDACEDCAQRYILMRSLVREVSSLPAIVPTPEESYRLTNRLRREMTAPAPPRTSSRRIQAAAAAMSILVVATVVGVTLAVWGGGSTTTVVEESAAEGEGVAEMEKDIARDQTLLTDAFTGTTDAATAALARPALSVSGQEYDAGDLEGYRNDLGTRLEFYSAYWYPTSGNAVEPAALARLQGNLTADLAAQAGAAGQNPTELEQAIAAVLEQAGDEPVLPCYAERAKVDGKDTWLVSVSGPEDYILFPDQERPPAMILASLGGEQSLKISESLLRELAARLAEQYGAGMPLITAGAVKGQEARSETDASAGGAVPSTPQGTADGDTAQAEKDFQAFLRGLAAQGTNLDLVTALEGLDYEQLLMIVHGDWAALAADGVNLSDFLAPPKHLWAVDCASGEVVWQSK
jgi:hypothetical protein